ncbi:MAG: phosphoglycolate phosphatase [Bryobacterales bacterium]|nr:phosphoglycolate phosphatase [Bryobacterales bacterium]
MQWKLVVFDLDGTLIDSALDLVLAVNATRAHYGLAELPPETIASYVGNGAPTLIRRSMGEGYSDEELAAALEVFVHCYRAHALDNTVLYPGVRGTLRVLREAGVLCAVLTNKPVRISKEILDGLGLREQFFEVYGGNSFAYKKPDPDGLLRLMEQAGCTPSQTLMVGDSRVDIETARNAGCASCGVTFGLQPETLSAPDPDFVIDAMAELAPIVLRREVTGDAGELSDGASPLFCEDPEESATLR